VAKCHSPNGTEKVADHHGLAHDLLGLLDHGEHLLAAYVSIEKMKEMRGTVKVSF
jgi:hypothetical protein